MSGTYDGIIMAHVHISIDEVAYYRTREKALAREKMQMAVPWTSITDSTLPVSVLDTRKKRKVNKQSIMRATYAVPVVLVGGKDHPGVG